MGTRAGENGVSGRTGILRCDVREESSTSHENEGLGLVHSAPVAPLAGRSVKKADMRWVPGAGHARRLEDGYRVWVGAYRSRPHRSRHRRRLRPRRAARGAPSTPNPQGCRA